MIYLTNLLTIPKVLLGGLLNIPRFNYPTNHIVMIGDSNVYGFDTWLYDNSWSMSQPFATHHLLHEQLGSDIISYGYQVLELLDIA